MAFPEVLDSGSKDYHEFTIVGGVRVWRTLEYTNRACEEEFWSGLVWRSQAKVDEAARTIKESLERGHGLIKVNFPRWNETMRTQSKLVQDRTNHCV